MESIVFQNQHQVIGNSEGGDELINKVEKLFEFRYENDLELLEKEVLKKVLE